MQVNLASAPDSRAPSYKSRAVGYDARALNDAMCARVLRLLFSRRQRVDLAARTDRAYDFGHRVSHNVTVTFVVNVRGPLEALDRPSVSLRFCV
jgi:hypothetical protein